MQIKLEANTYIPLGGGVDFHYPDTSVVFSLVGNTMYMMDRDSPLHDHFSNGDFTEVLLVLLGGAGFDEFTLDFCDKGLYLNSNYDTYSIELKSELFEQ